MGYEERLLRITKPAIAEEQNPPTSPCTGRAPRFGSLRCELPAAKDRGESDEAASFASELMRTAQVPVGPLRASQIGDAAVMRKSAVVHLCLLIGL
jgi:hypothetical protein